MISKPVVLALLAAGCLTAAAGGAYVAVRQNAAEPTGAVSALAVPAATPDAAVPVAATEAEVAPAAPGGSTAGTAAVSPTPETPEPVEVAPPKPKPSRPVDRPRTEQRRAPAPVRQAPVDRTFEPAATSIAASPSAAPARPEAAWPEPVKMPEAPPTPPEPEFIELVVPVSSVIGLQVETPLSSERAQLEDRVEGRVTRDVVAGDRVAIPAGTRVIGAVTLVERGGKVKERARLGVRFHTLVLANGTELPIRTDAVYRDGESPGRESAAKIGGAAVGGAILGAILGGGKGAAIGGATGAAGGTAAVMAGDRNAATLPAGTVLTIRLVEPVSVEVEKR